MVREGGLPGWLCGLVEAAFFVGCATHESRKKNEKNIFCLDCCASICPHCATSHRSHPLLQVRRYVYNDVVRLDDLEKLIDCSHVQPYTINSAKVVFLKPRPQSRPFKGSGNICLTCDRILQEPFHFCSLSCKVDHIVVQGEDLSSILYRFDESDFADVASFDSFPADVVGSDVVVFESAAVIAVSAASSCGRPEAPPSVKKKKKKAGGGGGGGGGFFPQMVLSLGSRRKGSPHRSPLS